MISTILLAVSVALLALGFYRWVRLNNDYFAKRKIAYVPPTFLLGSTGGFYLKQHRINEFVRGLYNQFPNEKFFGIFDLRQPLLVLRDPQLIAQLVVKDFDHFEDHRFLIDSVDDDVLGNALLLLRGQKWRHMRSTLSPAFTGRRMRQMFELVNTSCADMTAGLGAMCDKDGRKPSAGVVLDMKEVFARYANDVIVSTAFGYHVNSFADPQNEFLLNAKRMLGCLGCVRAVLTVIGGRICPWLVRGLGVQMMDAEVKEFFRNVVLKTIRERQEKNLYRPDMIDMLAHLKRGTNVIRGAESKSAAETSEQCDCPTGESVPEGFAAAPEASVGDGAADHAWTDNEMVAQCFLFFLAGFDTVSSVLSFLAYELAINPDVQQQLYEECRQVRQELTEATTDDGTIAQVSYDRLQRMQYMDQVVCEVLRMWPPAMLTDRYCGKDYAYDDGELRFAVQKGTSVWIPIAGLHHDAKYFHSPESFMPERFSDENRHAIVSGSYLPFGVGPRNCIASRFALMEVKAIVYHLMLEFSFEPTIKTQIPIRLAKATGGMETEQGIHLELKRRQK